ncbi:MAG TPA: ATP-binding protein, partial [Myxococcaceae bacterium]|nr:ATP-binding protein [Myxococcaceae bacterium]
RRVRLETQMASELPPVLGDAVQLQQVLMNLLMNAMDAMEGVDPKQRVVQVTTAAERGERVRLEVTDAGPGVDPDARARLFEPFFTTKPNGLGMGLALCRSIAEAHGGRIQPLERPGPGTTFQVSFPARRR